MLIAVFLLAVVGLRAQTDVLSRAYESLRARDYEEAVGHFIKAIDAAPDRANIRKDLAYTYLKIGENELARSQFGEAMRLEPDDSHVALEYAFLSYEAKQEAEARRIFDRIRRLGNAVAEQAFQNIDRPLAEGIERWRSAIARGGASFSAHFELATLARQRDELELAAQHYEAAWKLLPDRRAVLVELGRVWRAMGRAGDANAALLAASRGGEARAAETPRPVAVRRAPPRWRANCFPRDIPLCRSSGARSRSTPPTMSCGASWRICFCAWSGRPRRRRNFRSSPIPCRAISFPPPN
jgi:Tfp pilus assembly protein PilF